MIRSKVFSNMSFRLMQICKVSEWNLNMINIFFTATRMFDYICKHNLVSNREYLVSNICLNLSMSLHNDSRCSSIRNDALTMSIINAVFSDRSSYTIYSPMEYIQVNLFTNKALLFTIAMKVIAELESSTFNCQEISQIILSRLA
jgi:hypothetical protein